MTALASPPSYQAGLSRNGWANNTGNAMSINAMNSDEVSRIFVPRKSAQRSSSSSSLSSNASSASGSTISTASIQTNGASNGDSNPTRRKPAKLWPSSKAEPVAGISNARSQSVPAAPSGPTAASAISALHTPSIPSQSNGQAQQQSNGTARVQAQPDNPAMLNLLPMNGTFERKTITVPYVPDVLRIGRQTNAKTVPTPVNGYFDSKVLSRQHAEIWAERDGKIWIRDVKSSNGTFVNGKRLSQENRESEPHPLKEADVLELGIDIISEDQKTVVHHKVAARVEHAGAYGLQQSPMDAELDSFNQMRARAGTNGGRLNGNLSAAAYHAKWLQPVTIEQIAKRLRTELRQARLQSQDLHHTSKFVEAVTVDGNAPPPPQQKIVSPSRTSDIKSRFSSEPPAPPPSQPLPEKPDVASRAKLPDLQALQPMLRRSDTEKPKLTSPGGATDSPIKNDPSQSIAHLVEALSSARIEITSQSEKLRELEDSLKQERKARETAEERAVQLEASPSASATVDITETPSQDQEEDDQPSRLQERLELLRSEMEEMRMQMEAYRQRAENAELERDQDRKSLAEMVNTIRKRDDSMRKRDANKARRNLQENKASGAQNDGSDSNPDADDDEVLDDELNGVLGKALSRQRTVRPEGVNGFAISEADFDKAVAEAARALSTGDTGAIIQRTRQDQLAQSAPYLSIVAVVILGVSVMQYLNGWKAVER